MYRILAIDPSYKRTGVCIQSGDSPYPFSIWKGEEFPNVPGTLLHSLSVDAGKTFPDAFKDATEQSNNLVSLCSINGCLTEYDQIIMEYPPAVGKWSGGLYMLDSIILKDLIAFFSSKETQIYLVPPNAINSFFFKKRKVSKTEIVNLVKEKFQLGKMKINHDEASALLLIDLVKNKVIGKSPVIFRTNATLKNIERL